MNVDVFILTPTFIEDNRKCLPMSTHTVFTHPMVMLQFSVSHGVNSPISNIFRISYFRIPFVLPHSLNCFRICIPLHMTALLRYK